MTPSLELLSELEKELHESASAASRWERSAFLGQVKENHSRGGALLSDAHREGAGGLELCAARSAFIDALLGQVWSHALCAWEEETRRPEALPPCAMLAIGGYGRGELSPGSDIDLLFLFPKRSAEGSRLVRTALYLLWDAGLNIGHSARTLPECMRIAREDFQSETAMLEFRLVAGEEEVAAEFSRRLQGHLRRSGKSSHLKRRLRERSERYSSWDPSVYVQEPNIKESAGGLRDLHMVLWLARVFGAEGLEG
ncbi:MAG: nucleotidyltransferase domain-containing protein, partial [bacterium]